MYRVLEDDTLTVAVYGGVFQDVMDEELFAPFEEEVDFEVESEAQPTSEEALTQYENAVGAGKRPSTSPSWLRPASCRV